jgi:hypothetical protein
MEKRIKINQSALKHGIFEQDICLAIENFIYEDPVESEENKFLLIGFDKSGNLLEIIYEFVDNEIIHVFHAMRCRKSVLDLFER